MDARARAAAERSRFGLRRGGRIMGSESDAMAAKSADTAVLESEGLPLDVDACGRSDRGRFRENNEDHFTIAELAKMMRVDQTSLPEPGERPDANHAHLFVVADGMGGYAGGEVASRIAVHTVEECLLNSLKRFLGGRG